MATIKEVAEQAGVSVATVSRVANKSGYVSIALRERVEEAMRTLNYRPSALAQGLRRQETLTIGVLVPQLNQPFFSALTFALERRLFADNYRTLICSSEEDGSREAAYIDMLLHQRVDGVIMVATGHSTDNVRRLQDAGVPVVLVDRDVPGIHIARVLSDNRKGAVAAATHLASLGHRDIALIGGPPHSEVIAARASGAIEEFARHGITLPRNRLLIRELPQFDMGYQIARDLLNDLQPPTAIFALTDVIAVGVMHAAYSLDRRIPDDLSVIGFDDIPLAAYVIPGLTTVAQPIEQMGETAADWMIRRLRRNATDDETMMLDTHLTLRQTTSAPRLTDHADGTGSA